MAVYKRGPLGLDLPPMDGLAGPLIAILVIVGIFLLLPNATSNVLNAHVLANPLFLSVGDSTILVVNVNNPTNESLTNIHVMVKAVGSTQLSVYPHEQTIPSLGPQESRTLEYLVVPIDAESSPFLPGSYRIDVSTKLGDIPYQTSVTINVEK